MGATIVDKALTPDAYDCQLEPRSGPGTQEEVGSAVCDHLCTLSVMSGGR